MQVSGRSPTRNCNLLANRRMQQSSVFFQRIAACKNVAGSCTKVLVRLAADPRSVRRHWRSRLWPGRRLKVKIEERFAPSLRGRVAIHMTSYRAAVSEGGRAWLLVDQTEIPLAGIQPVDTAQGPGHHNQWSVHDALVAYLDLSIEQALLASDPLHRALALLDCRLGRRRFESLAVSSEDPELVRQLYQLRADGEGWRAVGTAAR